MGSRISLARTSANAQPRNLTPTPILIAVHCAVTPARRLTGPHDGDRRPYAQIEVAAGVYQLPLVQVLITARLRLRLVRFVGRTGLSGEQGVTTAPDPQQTLDCVGYGNGV